MDVVEQQTETLELHTNALQILLGEPGTAAPCSPLPLARYPMPSQTGPLSSLSGLHDIRAWDVRLTGCSIPCPWAVSARSFDSHAWHSVDAP